MIVHPITTNFNIQKHSSIAQITPSRYCAFKSVQTSTTGDSIKLSSYQHKYDIDSAYKDIQQKLEVVSGKDIENLITKINKNFPDLNNDEILTIMDTLSDYSSYRSMNNIAKNLYNNDFLGVYDFAQELSYKTIRIKTNTQNEQNTNNRTLKIPSKHPTQTITQVPKGLGVPLGTILDYLTFGKYIMDFKSRKLALILDKNSIKLLQNTKKASPDYFKTEFLNNDTFVPVYIDNFENSYNFLNQGKTFEQAAISFIKKYKNLKSKNPNLPQEKIIDILLNYKNLKNIKELGFSPLRIKPQKQEPPTPETIANKLNPLLPDRETFEKTINSIAKDSNLEQEKTKQLIFGYLDKNLAIYSPHTLSKKLIELHKKIVKSAEEKGYPSKNIYYTVLHPNKSFGLIAYQFQKANKIPDDKIVYWIGSCHQPNINFDPPEKSTIVILDDCFISGNTVMYEMFNYEQEASFLNTNKKDTNLIFASVLGTNSAKTRLKNNIKHAKREHFDTVINIDTKNTNWSDNMKKQSGLFDFLKTLRKDTHLLATTAVVFPYMGSDTNAPGLRNFFKLFVPNPNYLHKEVSKDDFFS